MTCLVFILLKAFGVWETPYDFGVALGLLGLDLIFWSVVWVGRAEWTRIWLYRQGR